MPLTVDNFMRSHVLTSAPDGLKVEVDDHTAPGYSASLRRAFNFLRRSSSRRYSNSALMAIINAADAVEYGTTREDTPLVFTLGQEVAYDEDTEIKSGGVVGMAVRFGDDSGKTMLAVTEAHRRSGYGRALLRSVVAVTGSASLWVATGNVTGQQFLLANGLTPTMMNSQGALCYGNADHVELVDDSIYAIPTDEYHDPVAARPSRRR